MSSFSSTSVARVHVPLLALTLGLSLSVSGAHAGNVPLPLGAGSAIAGAGRPGASIRVESLREARFRRTVRQSYDFSCGAAAVATLLTYHYGRSTSEAEVFREMWTSGDQEKIQRVGFSLLDMKQFLNGNGYPANGYRIGLSDLRAANVPAIALITTAGYRHFVVLQGISSASVLLSDPALGLREMSRAGFEAIRDPILLVIRPSKDRPVAQLLDRWQLRPAAPLEVRELRSGITRARHQLLLPTVGEF